MRRPTVVGAAYSVHVRSARLALEEKGVDYDLEEVDVFAPGGPPDGYESRHPFGKIPALEHDGFRLYETQAIMRYVDAVFDGPPLRPAAPRAAARMDQILGILDGHAYRTLVWDVFVERIRAPERGRVPDEDRIRNALPRAETCLRAIERLKGGSLWLAGPEITLADLHAAPMIALFRRAADGADLLAGHGQLARWWERIAARDSMVATEPSSG